MTLNIFFNINVDIDTVMSLSYLVCLFNDTGMFDEIQDCLGLLVLIVVRYRYSIAAPTTQTNKSKSSV